jgi:predicted secreted protein
MAIVKGQNLRLFVGSRAIAAALDCQLQVQLNVTPYSTKDDEGSFTKNRVVSLQWSVTANAVVVDDVELDAIGAAELTDLIGQDVQVQLNTTNGEKNREGVEQLLAGEAIVSDVQYTAQNRQRSTYQVTLTGKKNMLIDLRYIVTTDEYYIRTADNHIVMAAHDPNAE